MLLAACFGSVGKMQTMDTIRNHGGDHINLFLRQFCIGVQKPRKASQTYLSFLIIHIQL